MKSLLRKLGIPAVALAGMLALFTPSSADAKVHFGIGIGVSPYWSYPYQYPYYGPYYYGNPYVYGGGWGWGHGGYHYHYHGHHR